MVRVDDVGGWSAVFGRLIVGDDLSGQQARAAVATILDGDATDAQIAALIVALRLKGETVAEVSAMVDAMLDEAAPLTVPDGTIDIVGTGGSPQRRVRALNVSTMASVVAAAGGAVVCKHGNYRASSTSGSFDLLEALGVRVDLDGSHIATCLSELGLAFCFARSFHPAMRHAAPVRAELGVPTVFNVLGPLSHPGRLRRQVIGIGDDRILDLVAGVLADRGCEHALVVHGSDSLDEITLSGTTTVVEVRDAEVVGRSVIAPEDFGFRPVTPAEMPGGDPDANRTLAQGVFNGEDGPVKDIVTLNAGAGLYVAGVAESIEAGVEAARSAVDSGAAGEILGRLVDLTAELAAAD